MYTYIKDAERLLDEMDIKRKKERKEMQATHAKELKKMHISYQKQINDLKREINYNVTTENKYSSKPADDRLVEELNSKNMLLEEANDQIVCLKSKLHGLRTIITQLKTVEKKYNNMLSKQSYESSDEKFVYKSKEQKPKTFKKSRNSYVKTSRTNNQIANDNDSVINSKQKEHKNEPKRKVKSRRRSKLKINLKENNIYDQMVPHSVHAKHFKNQEDLILRPSQTYHENLNEQRQGLLDRMNRIECIISSGKSFDRARDSKFDP